jgi:hypothetical protein
LLGCASNCLTKASSYGIEPANLSPVGHVRDRKGGIIWHTQGSGKSIVMVLLAKWILENNPNARVAIITVVRPPIIDHLGDPSRVSLPRGDR